ncbi:MAG: hypothetical protein ACYTGC_07425, partial [Planctomycetota bacterium]
MEATLEGSVREQLEDRRERLEAIVSEVGEADDLTCLLRQVDAAIDRLGTADFGRCEVCDGRVSDAQLQAQPTLTYCLCELSAEQQAALQRDLNLAWRVQSALLPKQEVSHAGWDVHFRY